MKTTVRLMTIAATGLLCLAVYAQDKPAAKKKSTGSTAMPKPKPAPEMTELRDMIGAFVSEAKFEPSPMMPGGDTSTGTANARFGPGGFSVLIDARSKSATSGSFTGHGAWSWDPNEKAYKSVWLDSMTPGMISATGHKEGNNLVFTGEAIMMGKKISYKDVYSDRSPNSFKLTSYMNDGSGERLFATMKFTRQEAAPKQ